MALLQMILEIFLLKCFLSVMFIGNLHLCFWVMPTEEQIKAKLISAVSEGKLTQDEADSKLKSILSGDFKGKKPGRFGEK